MSVILENFQLWDDRMATSLSKCKIKISEFYFKGSFITDSQLETIFKYRFI
jgi:hypothetical protein